MKLLSIFAISVAFIGAPAAFAGEHPHPTKKAEEQADKEKKHEEAAAETSVGDTKHKGEKHVCKEGDKHKCDQKHKEEKAKDKTGWNAKQVEQDLVSFINGKATQSGGRFAVNDELSEQTRQLKLKKIHTEKIMEMRDGTSFVCADFTDATGELVDVDFFMQPSSTGTVDQVTQVQIHKVNGKQRFTYVLDEGKWLQKAVN
jgi:hypothetical protein